MRSETICFCLTRFQANSALNVRELQFPSNWSFCPQKAFPRTQEVGKRVSQSAETRSNTMIFSEFFTLACS